MFKILTMNTIASAGIDVLHKHGCQVSASMDNPEGLLLRSADLHSVEFPKELLAIARAGAGTNNIPIERCTEEGIAVFNAPGANAEAVKEQEMAALVMSSRDVLGSIAWVRSIADRGAEIPALVEKGKSAFAGPELLGKTLGVIGLGATGAQVANAALAIGMDVVGYDPFLSVDGAWMLAKEIRHADQLDEIFEQSDYISLNIPYTEDTHHMLNEIAFAKMKNGVRILNESRAEVVDDEAMTPRARGRQGRQVCHRFPERADFEGPERDRHAASRRLHARERGPLRRHGRERDVRLSAQRQHQKLREPAERRAQPHGRVPPVRHPPQRPAHDHAHPRFHQREEHQRRAHDQQAPRRVRLHDRRPGRAHRGGHSREHPPDAERAAGESDMKKIGMLVAVEMGAVLSRYGTAREVETRHGFEVHTYDMDGYTLYVMHSGAGEIAAAAAAAAAHRPL